MGGPNPERVSDAYLSPAALADDVDVARFTGRRSLVAHIEDFIASRGRGYVLVRAEAGVGKTTLAAHLVRSHPWHHHFTRLPGGRSPRAARRNLAAQLIARWNLADDWAPGGAFPSAADRPDWFADLLYAAARRRDERRPETPIVLVVDGLDEVGTEGFRAGSDGGLPLDLPASLPHGVFVIATTRFGIEWALHSVRNPVLWLTIDVDGTENLADIRRYIQRVTDPATGDPAILRALDRGKVDVEWFRRTLAARCAGVWIYLRYVLDEIRDGAHCAGHIDTLPGDLAGFYAQQMQRWRGARDSDRDAERWERMRVPLLVTLAAAGEPLTVAELTAFAGLDGEHHARVFVDETARAFLYRGGEPGQPPRYALRHQSLRDFLTATGAPPSRPDIEPLMKWFAEEVQAAHARIARACLPPCREGQRRDWDACTEYARRHLAVHAAVAGLLDDLVADPGFLGTMLPESVLSVRSRLGSTHGTRAMSAYELCLDGWAGLTARQRISRLHAAASRTGATHLARASADAGHLTWPIRYAWWSGVGHLVLSGHQGTVEAVAWGRVAGRAVIVSGGQDGTVWVWDVSRGTPVGAPLAGHRGPVSAVAMVRLAGHDVIVSAGWDATIRIWDAHTHRPVADVTPGHVGPVHAIAVVRTGGADAGRIDAIASAGEDGTIRISDPTTGRPVRKPLRGHRRWIGALITVPVDDGDILVSAGADGTIRIWDPRTGAQVREPLTGHTGAVGTLAAGWHGGERTIVSGGADGTVRIWNPVTGGTIGAPLTGHTGPVAAVVAGPGRDEPVIASVGWDGTARVWYPPWSAPISRTLTGHIGQVATVTTGRAAERPLVVSGGWDTTIRIWELRDEPSPTGHTDRVRAVRLARLNGRLLVLSGSWDTTVRLWDPITGCPVGPPLVGHTGAVEAIAVGRLGGREVIISGSWDATIRIWDPFTGRLVREPLTGHDGPVGGVAVNRLGDRDVIVSSSADATIRVWDAVTGRQLRPPLTGHSGAVGGIVLCRFHARPIIISGGADATVRAWDLAEGKPLGPPLTGHGGWIRAIATGHLRGRRVVVSGGGDATIRVWDLDTGRQLGEPLTGHQGPVDAMASGRLDGCPVIITGGWDTTVRIWDLAARRQVDEPLLGHDDWVQAVAFGRVNGREAIVSGGEDRAVLVRERVPTVAP